MKNVSIHTIAEIAILTAMMTILGGIKIPNLIPGVEFQLSAPLAVAICAAFGFRKYIICGCLSSLIGLVLGTQNLLNVAIAMQFRLIVGLILWIGKNRMWSILISGPIASAIARITIGLSLANGHSYACDGSTWHDFHSHCKPYLLQYLATSTTLSYYVESASRLVSHGL